MIVPTKVQRNDINETSYNNVEVIELVPNKRLSVYCGAIRSHYNNQFFRKKKNKIADTILSPLEKKNIDLNVKSRVESGLYSKIKKGNCTPLVNIHGHTVIVKKEVCTYITDKFELNFYSKDLIESGEYLNCSIIEKDGKPFLLVPKIKEEIIDRTLHISDLKSEVLIKVLRKKRRDDVLNAGEAPTENLKRIQTKLKDRTYKSMQYDLFKVLDDLNKNFNIQFECIKVFTESLNSNSSENQRTIMGYVLSTEVRELLLEEYLTKDEDIDNDLYEILEYS